ncbi:MAG: rod shape-determining protein RodA [Gammaproteobacteria bacterium]|nr:rod shape-determining protein RodA [Gammaproteobacteria bacterium]
MGRMLMRLHVDGPLLLLLLLICGLGLFILYSADGQSMARVNRQLVRMFVAFCAALIIAQLSPNLLRLWSPWMFAGGVVLLVLVEFTGESGKGAQRWLDVGLFTFQPSEIMKLAVPMMLAWYYHNRPLPPDLRMLAMGLLLIVIPTTLILRQPDLGTSLLIASSGVFVIYLAGLSVGLIVILNLLFAGIAPLYWHFFMHNFQRQRVLTFINPESDPLGAGYHIIQSKIAIGSGGIFGKGWQNGTQAQLEFLPERSTDFIFAVIGEEFGLLGLLTLLVLYLLVMARGLYIATQAQDTYSRLLAGSISLTFFLYVFVNTGMVTGLLPVVGVPLPLVSYGGTSMVTLMAGFGILMSIHSHRKFMAQ